ncbi:MAG: IspD/TarI family cytidylyltransferase [Anaeroplasma sp.]
MYSVILLMAGKGTRLGLNKNKVLLPIGEHLMFEYPLKTFSDLNFEIICVISKDDEKTLFPLLPKNVLYTYGGSTRGESVKNGLKMCHNQYVFIHDCARPFISKAVIEDIINNIDKKEAALVYTNVKDTIKINNNGLTTLDRSSLIAAATPQCAPKNILVSAYEKAENDGIEFTDDISLLEKYYPQIKINLVLGNEECFKITTKLDYELAKIVGGKFE